MQKINCLDDFQELFEIAFRKGSKESNSIGKKGKKTIAIVRIKTIQRDLEKKISSYIKSFPSIEELNPFYLELLETIISKDELRQSLGHLQKLHKMVGRITREELKWIRKTDEKKLFLTEKSFFGRINSLKKDFNPLIEKLNKVAKELNQFPVIEENAFVVILAGYPNTGKTTLLERLTKSKAQIASYPFTTKQLNIGFFESNYLRIQVIDTPGLLDKPFERKSLIEKKAVSALKNLAHLIVFVIDPSSFCGYPLEEQLNLLKQIKELKIPVLACINKTDIASPEQIREVELKLKNNFVHSNPKDVSELKNLLIEKIKKRKK